MASQQPAAPDLTAEDEWTDNYDPGFVELSVSESDFSELEAEARDSMRIAALALHRTMQEQQAAGIPPPGSDTVSNVPVVDIAKRNPSTGSSDWDKALKKANLDAYPVKVVHELKRTGFEVEKDFVPKRGDIVAGRYEVEEFLGAAAFSTAVQCRDLASSDDVVCLKIIRNNKDYLDQSLDEIKLLNLLKNSGDPEKHHVLRMIDYFYFKEHLFIVTELLKDNLYEFGKYIRNSGEEAYFTNENLQRIVRQLLQALKFIHGMGMIHCDIKPENILIQSYSQVTVKMIDFGSSCFTTDYLNSYVQSRSYRAPEVILGLPYGRKIDIWSLGAVVAELFSGYVLFQNNSLPSMLARITSVVGPIPHHMLLKGTEASKYFLSTSVVYERLSAAEAARNDGKTVRLMYPKRTTLKHRLPKGPPEFHTFLEGMLQVDPDKRFSAVDALADPWIQKGIDRERSKTPPPGRSRSRGAAQRQGAKASSARPGSATKTTGRNTTPKGLANAKDFPATGGAPPARDKPARTKTNWRTPVGGKK